MEEVPGYSGSELSATGSHRRDGRVAEAGAQFRPFRKALDSTLRAVCREIPELPRSLSSAFQEWSNSLQMKAQRLRRSVTEPGFLLSLPQSSFSEPSVAHLGMLSWLLRFSANEEKTGYITCVIKKCALRYFRVSISNQVPRYRAMSQVQNSPT